MVRAHRFRNAFATATAAYVLVAFSALASAQSAVECRANETQAECHARLKCGAYEELEECQKRLRERQDRKGDDARQQGDNRQRDDARQRGRDNADGADRRGSDRGHDRGSRGRQRRGDARRGGGGGGGGGGSSFQANKIFGLGLELGEPTGLTGKYFVSDSGALDFGLGWIYRHYYYGDGLHLYLDYLWHPTSLASTPSFELPFYIGVGFRFWDFEYCFQGVCGYGGSAMGVRVPLGIAFDFNTAPLDLFFQIVPVIDFLRGDYYDRYRDRAHFGVDASVGLRFWFK